MDAVKSAFKLGYDCPMDITTPEKRSELMSRIHDRDTMPEMIVRRLVHSMGYRYRLHQRRLPGTPDLVFASRHKVIFVHGCFWHLHTCPNVRFPKSRLEFWEPKLKENKRRDARQEEELKEMGWDSLVIWECETIDEGVLREKIVTFLGGNE
jgi:DNA mismatch endonuclease (patch repair protein)